ncbi:hypothetical protein C5167_040329 [Papaver somniferum]|uniref:GDT1 family protein n=1 Tax=Papaver somniferum TaxID=3469 RepID=A0A4Y7IET3_PAPSO|nr:hypothetical protein C5167_040329 [Papaver somniferum]
MDSRRRRPGGLNVLCYAFLFLLISVSVFAQDTEVEESNKELPKGSVKDLGRRSKIVLDPLDNENNNNNKNDINDVLGDVGVGEFAGSDGLGVFDAFFASLSMILVSEIGDETFIIAALMAMRHPKSIVLSGALSALFVMTATIAALLNKKLPWFATSRWKRICDSLTEIEFVHSYREVNFSADKLAKKGGGPARGEIEVFDVLSTGLGRIVPNLISRKHTNSAATVLYAFFGLRLLYIAWRSEKANQKKEIEEVEEKLEGGQGKSTFRRFLSRFLTPIFLESFILTFLAEWGDRSQIATIAKVSLTGLQFSYPQLATHKNAVGVAVGACIGHTICTSIAVVGGSMLASKISQGTVAMPDTGVLVDSFAPWLSAFLGQQLKMHYYLSTKAYY